MPAIIFQGKTIKCDYAENLRSVLLNNKESPYNGAAKILNCRGIGSCGTCAVSVAGKTNQRTYMEKWRLNFPPHEKNSSLRLACQVQVLGDLVVDKHPGFWGQHAG